MSAEELIVKIEEILSEFFEEGGAYTALDQINTAVENYYAEDDS